MCTAACVKQSFTRRLKFSTDIQFRFVQEEHAGGYCSCWGIGDLAIVHNGTTNSINARYVHCRLSHMHGHVCLKTASETRNAWSFHKEQNSQLTSETSIWLCWHPPNKTDPNFRKLNLPPTKLSMLVFSHSALGLELCPQYPTSYHCS